VRASAREREREECRRGGFGGVRSFRECLERERVRRKNKKGKVRYFSGEMTTGIVQDQNLEKQMGCMAGFLQIFDRHQLLAGKRFYSTKRLPPSSVSFFIFPV
jgi:hypothetical protein